MASALIQCVIRTQTGWIRGCAGALVSMLAMTSTLVENHRARKAQARWSKASYFVISSFFIIVSFLSIIPSDFFILSDVLDIESVFLSILSVFSILLSFIAGFIASSSKAAGAKARPVASIAA